MQNQLNEKLLLNRIEHEAIVVNEKDPDGLLRVQVRVHGLMDGIPADKLPWATYKLPVGHTTNRGDFTPAKVGHEVWVDFPYMTHGNPDTRRPRITGSVHYAPGGSLSFPNESYGKTFEHIRETIDPPAEKAGYHQCRVITINNSTIEHLPEGTIRVFNRDSGAIFEALPNGDAFVKGFRDVIIKADRDILMECKRDMKVKVGRDLFFDVIENTTWNIGKDHTETVGKDYTSTVGGNLGATISGNMTTEAYGNIRLTGAKIYWNT